MKYSMINRASLKGRVITLTYNKETKERSKELPRAHWAGQV